MDEDGPKRPRVPHFKGKYDWFDETETDNNSDDNIGDEYIDEFPSLSKENNIKKYQMCKPLRPLPVAAYSMYREQGSTSARSLTAERLHPEKHVTLEEEGGMSEKVRSYANAVSPKKEQRSTSLSPRRNQQVDYNRRAQSYERGKHLKLYDIRDCDDKETKEYIYSGRKGQDYLHEKRYDEERYANKSNKYKEEEYTLVSPHDRIQESLGAIFTKKGKASMDQQTKLTKLNSFLQGILSKQVEKRVDIVPGNEQLSAEIGKNEENVKSLTIQQESVEPAKIKEQSFETREIETLHVKDVSHADLGDAAKSGVGVIEAAKSSGKGIEAARSFKESETTNLSVSTDCNTVLESAGEEKNAMVNNTEEDQSASCLNDLEQLIETLTLEPDEEDVSKIQTLADTVKTSSDLKELANIIYNRCMKDWEFGKTGACLCDRLANMEVEGSKFRNIMLSLVQLDYKDKDSIRTKSPGKFLGFVTFLCQVFGNMRTAKGEPFNVLSGPIYDCIYTIFNDDNSSDDDYECLLLQVQSIGKELEAFDEFKMSELMEKVRTKIIKDGRSARARCSLLELLESYNKGWKTLPNEITRYYCDTMAEIFTDAIC
ncbi:CBP80/20-dependent translation initiation factor-like [Mytilus trossulus]|uniref:CBP80/20-dependent translation initiation factor-like n=1 Tax=Mytilus trossulus TaxID=6551 RepID=UPI0030049151